MTRKEVTGIRDLEFSGWIRSKLPDSATGYSASDLDFILWNWKTKKIMFLEIKTRNVLPRKGQEIMFDFLNKWIAKGIDSEWTYLGFHYIKFEKTNFEDGKCFLNNNEISEIDLICFLNMEEKTR